MISYFYQSIDVLIIDDVQFFCGKEKTQDVFFHIFNHLHQNGKQIILTSDKAFLLILLVWNKDYYLDLNGVLLSDLQSPELETRLAILKRKSKMMVLKFLMKLLST